MASLRFMIEQFDSAWNVFEFDPRLHASSALKDSTTREPREYAKRTAERAVAAELSYGTNATTRPQQPSHGTDATAHRGQH